MNFSSFKHSYFKADKRLGVINESVWNDNTMEVCRNFLLRTNSSKHSFFFSLKVYWLFSHYYFLTPLEFWYSMCMYLLFGLSIEITFVVIYTKNIISQLIKLFRSYCPRHLIFVVRLSMERTEKIEVWKTYAISQN